MSENQLEITVENQKIIDRVKGNLLNTVLRSESLIPPKLILYFMDRILTNQVYINSGYSMQEVIAKAGVQEYSNEAILGMIKIINGMTLQDRILEDLITHGYKFEHSEKSTKEELEKIQLVLLVIRELILEIK